MGAHVRVHARTRESVRTAQIRKLDQPAHHSSVFSGIYKSFGRLIDMQRTLQRTLQQLLQRTTHCKSFGHCIGLQRTLQHARQHALQHTLQHTTHCKSFRHRVDVQSTLQHTLQHTLQNTCCRSALRRVVALRCLKDLQCVAACGMLQSVVQSVLQSVMQSCLRSFLEAGFRPLCPPFVYFVTLSRTKPAFWISTRTAQGPISQVLPGCRARQPQYSMKLSCGVMQSVMQSVFSRVEAVGLRS